MRHFLVLWRVWTRLGRWMGHYVSRLALTAFYFTVALPFGVVMRLGRDPLQIKKADLTWRARHPDETTLRRARNLF